MDSQSMTQTLRRFTATDLEGLSAKAAGDGRLRAHLNVHPALEDPVQRLFIALEPGTYVRPHRHPEPNKWELFVLINGAVDAILLGDDGSVLERIPMGGNGARAVEVPPNAWHSYVCLEPGTLVLEVKEGPYVPTTPEHFAPWSPQDDPAAVAEYLDWLHRARPVRAPSDRP
jgi:cupin fold WbuC family metalloprotein